MGESSGLGPSVAGQARPLTLLLPVKAFGHPITLSPVLPIPLQVKCDQYWPARGTETYGLIQVTLVDTVELATYTMRTFALHKVWPSLPWLSSTT